MKKIFAMATRNMFFTRSVTMTMQKLFSSMCKKHTGLSMKIGGTSLFGLGKLLLLCIALTIVGCEGSIDTPDASSNQNTTPSPSPTPGPAPAPSPPPPSGDNMQNLFAATLYPVLTANCGACHGSLPNSPGGTPDFAHDNVTVAYGEIVARPDFVNLGAPANSRLVTKPLELHKCIAAVCQIWADAITLAIVEWANLVPATGGGGTSGQAILSSTLALADGVQNAGAGRVEDAIIAKYEFKTGTGQTAFDTSGVAPAIDLTLSADVNWVAGQGIDITDPNAAGVSKAVGTAAASIKLYDMIAGPQGSQQYTIEAWVINASTALDGPARLVSYSLDSQNRNFTMGQQTSYYNFRNRSNLTGNNGSNPALETDNGAGDLKTELQHVVFTFDGTNGRNIYINGIKPAYEGVASDPSVPANISNNWNSTYTFILGNEVPDGTIRQWLGKMLFVAIHNRALTPAEILQNTLAGIGEKFILDFDVSALLDTSGATTSKISLIVSELDAFSYVFATPTLTTTIAVPSIAVKDIRIMVNNNIPIAAQAFRNVDMTVTSTGTELSPLGAVIPKDIGPDTDLFVLVFAVLGNNSNIVIEPNPQPVLDLSVNAPSPEFGLRTFEQINNTMANLTGIDPSVTKATFDDLQQQLPSTPNLETFVAAHQVGIAKLSLEYCDAMVEDGPSRLAFFGSGFVLDPTFANQGTIITALVDKMVGTNLASQPSLAELTPELNQLFTELGCNAATPCDAARTRTVVKAACAAVLGSAAVLIN